MNYATVFLVAMVPVIELRGAIPIGIAMGLEPLVVYILAVIGNFIPAPFIILLIRQIFQWLKKSEKLRPKIEKLEEKGEKKGEIIRKYRLLGLFILVAIPCPGTGAWTGALAAAILKIRLKTALPAILLGLLTAGGIVLAISCGVASAVK